MAVSAVAPTPEQARSSTDATQAARLANALSMTGSGIEPRQDSETDVGQNGRE